MVWGLPIGAMWIVQACSFGRGMMRVRTAISISHRRVGVLTMPWVIWPHAQVQHRAFVCLGVCVGGHYIHSVDIYITLER